MAAYNKNRNYKDEIDKAAAAGNFVLAGSLERERNAKIDGEGLSYAKTNEYAPYLDKDYSESIMENIRSGASGSEIQADHDTRNQKTRLPGYTQYADDDVSRKAQAYIDYSNTLNTPFTYEGRSAQVSARQKELDKLTNALKTYREFSYNPETDPLYAALAAQYTKNGQRAMQDTLAEASARTGGLASSYAASAGNQAYANYMSELASKVPELQQLAYQMYNDEYNRKLQQAQMAQSMYESELARYQNDRSFAYGQYADNRNMAYNRLNDMIAGERYVDETEYSRGQDALEQNNYLAAIAREDAWNKAQILAEAGNYDGYRELGFTDAQINQIEYANAAKNAPKVTASGSGGKKADDGGDPKKGYVETMLSLGSEAEVEEWLIRQNFSESEKETLRELYQNAKEAAEPPPPKSTGRRTELFVTRNQAYEMAASGKSGAEITAYLEAMERKLTDEDIDNIIKSLDAAYPGWDK